jgi:beta-N-acetylhexosaminidase
LNDILRGQLGFDGAVFSDDLSMAGARLLDGREVSYTEAAVTALNAGCDMVLLCNQSLDGGHAVDELISGITESQLKGQWQPRDASGERRQSLLPRTNALEWDHLMVDPTYMRAMELLP